MFKTQVEPRATGEWFHFKVLNILWRHFYGEHKSVDHGKLWSICFLQQHLFFYEKAKQTAARDMLRHFHGVYSHRP